MIFDLKPELERQKMRILHLDCSNGVSGDMMLRALAELGECSEEVAAKMAAADKADTAACDGAHSHGRSYKEVREMINGSGFSQKARETALRIYGHIAEAEAKVHGKTPETVHFHEVGRDEAVKNALGIGMALEIIAPDKVTVSTICDGSGTVVCSHGEIPVPVPAVQALREKCSYSFETVDVDMEMVTPSGLAAVMGIGAEPGEMAGDIIKKAEAAGMRDTGRGGFKAYITEVREPGQAAASPEPKQAAASPEPKQAAARPEPEQAAASPERRQAAASPEPGQAAASPEPKQAAASPEPKQAAARPEPEQAAAKPEPKQAAARPEPEDPDGPKPVRNPLLKEAAKLARENPSMENSVRFLNEVVRARLLIPVSMDKSPVYDKELDEIILEENTEISFELIKAANGDIYYPVFTDGEEMLKCGIGRGQQSMIVNFDDLAAMLLSPVNAVAGFAINPMSDNMCFTTDMVAAMKKDMEKEGRH